MIKALSVLPLLAAAASEGKDISIEKARFVDKFGRHLIFHGVNVVYKVPPYLPDTDDFDGDTSMTEQDMDDLAAWGINFVRLGVMWEAVEKEAGVYDLAYLDRVQALINKLGERGIYTLVDAHQDVFARQICGEGFPNFYARQILAEMPNYCVSPLVDELIGALGIKEAIGFCKSIDDYGYRKDDDGLPVIEDCQSIDFGVYYQTVEALTVQRAIYYNQLGMRDKFVAFWAAVNDKLGANPYVIGIDPLNEPAYSSKDLASALYNLLPGVYDRELLGPLYEDIYDVAKDSGIMMFEPPTAPDFWAAATAGWQWLEVVFPVGWQKPPGGEIGSTQHVLNGHTYCCQLNSDVCSATGEPAERFADDCYGWHQMRIGQRQADADRMEIPYFLGEFGACMDTDDCVREIRQATDIADETLAGWAYWQFKTYKDPTTSAGDKSEGFYNKDGSIQGKKVALLARTSVMAAQGATVSQLFNATTGDFTADITIDSSIDAPTVIQTLVNSTHGEPAWYADGAQVTLTLDGEPIDASLVDVYSLADLARHHLPVPENKYAFKLGDQFDGKTITVTI